MKDFISRASIRDELSLFLRKSEGDCRSSWRNLTSCQVSLPQRSDLMIRVYGGSDMDQVLFQSIVDRPTNTVGLTGQIPWNPSIQLPTVVSIVIAVGQTEYILGEILAQESFLLEWYVFRRPTRSRGSLPRSRVRISGASKISGTTFANDPSVLGLIDLFVLTINRLTKSFVSWGPGAARLLPLIYQRLAIVSLVTLLGRCFGVIRNSYAALERLVPK
jgi:hypothetical protein